MKRVHVKVDVVLILNMADGIEVDDVINEMDYNFTSTIEGVGVHDSTIEDFVIIRSE